MSGSWSVNSIIVYISLFTYIIVSKAIFDQVYVTSKQIIDEEFHIPQGLAYCNYHFDSWNPKITTLPGLYVISSLLLSTFDLCLIYWLRFINLVASLLNLYLFYTLFKLHNKKAKLWKNMLSSINLSILPPLYFFSHVYYTDILSLTFILLMFVFEKQRKHIFVSITGICAIIMRQTNIIWLLMIFGRYVLINTFHNVLRIKPKMIDERISEEDIKELKRGIHLRNFSLDVWLNISSYLIVFVTFVSFVIFNGGVVVGDKDAHSVSLHVPQIFYYSLFAFVFMWPFFVPKLQAFVYFASRRKLSLVVLFLIFAAIVYLNTSIHPYLLADNRHYTFYIWNRAYGKYASVRYLMIFGYIYFFYCIFQIAYSKNDISFALTYLPCTVAVLIFQKMIEVRYFLVPYVLLRLNVKDASRNQLIAEFLFSLFINYLTFDVFFTKNIYWVDYHHAQKIIW